MVATLRVALQQMPNFFLFFSFGKIIIRMTGLGGRVKRCTCMLRDLMRAEKTGMKRGVEGVERCG